MDTSAKNIPTAQSSTCSKMVGWPLSGWSECESVGSHHRRACAGAKQVRTPDGWTVNYPAPNSANSKIIRSRIGTCPHTLANEFSHLFCLLGACLLLHYPQSQRGRHKRNLGRGNQRMDADVVWCKQLRCRFQGSLPDIISYLLHQYGRQLFEY